MTDIASLPSLNNSFGIDSVMLVRTSFRRFPVGIRANGKLGGQGSSADLNFPFADDPFGMQTHPRIRRHSPGTALVAPRCSSSYCSNAALKQLTLPNQLEVTCPRTRPDDPTIRDGEGPAVAFDCLSRDHRRGWNGELSAIHVYENSRGLQRDPVRLRPIRRIDGAFAGNGRYPG